MFSEKFLSKLFVSKSVSHVIVMLEVKTMGFFSDVSSVSFNWPKV